MIPQFNNIFKKLPLYQTQPKEGDAEKGGKELAGEEVTSFLISKIRVLGFFLCGEN